MVPIPTQISRSQYYSTSSNSTVVQDKAIGASGGDIYRDAARMSDLNEFKKSKTEFLRTLKSQTPQSTSLPVVVGQAMTQICCVYSVNDTATVHGPPSDQRSQGRGGRPLYDPRFRSAAAGSHVVSRGIADREFCGLRDPAGRRPSHALHTGGVLRRFRQVHGQSGQ